MNKLLLTLLLTALALTACGPTHVPRSVEIDSSLATTEWLNNEVGFVQNRSAHNYLNSLIKRLSKSIHKAALASKIESKITKEYANYPWQVFLLDSKSLNAFSSGAGANYITLGLLQTLKTEAELAAVLAHEMAHQLLEHPRAALSKAQISTASPEIAFSIKQEISADELGVAMLKVSGYDPRAALSALNYGYRQPEGGVAVRNNNLDTRIANIFLQLDNKASYRYASRNNSREFIKLKNSLR